VDWSESDYSQDTLARLERSGALISIACAPDACEVCRSKAQKLYAPPNAPRLPIQGCHAQRCRCWFVAVDPQSKLSVPQLVRRGIQALKAGQNTQAQRILQHAVTLDSTSEQGWFWLSGAVDDRSKIICLQKVLSINPNNERARAGLKSLREKQHARGTADVPAMEQQKRQPEPSHSQEPALASSVSIKVIETREERQIIAEQWCGFLSIAAATDPQMLLMQGNAFLTKMKRLNALALQSLPSESRLGELQLQWQESEIVGEALADLLHDPNHPGKPTWNEMCQALRKPAQQLLAHRNALRVQIKQAGGQTPQ
jgi:hypothetical protein